MALVAFHEQAHLYKTEAFSDFRRTKLVYAFQDLIESTSSITEETISAVNLLLELHQIDNEMMKYIGFDLLENVIKLHLISGVEIPSSIKELAISLAYHSNPQELLIQLNAVMSYFKIEDEEQTLQMFRNLNTYAKNIFKTLTTFFLTICLQRLEEKHLKTAIQELYIYIELLEFEIHETSEVMNSELIGKLLQTIDNKRLQLKINAAFETLKFLMKLLVVYEKAEKFRTFKEKVASLIFLMFGNLEQILETCKKNKATTDLSNEILVLAGMICDPLSSFKLPFILSGKRRLEILLLSCLKSALSFPTAFKRIFTHTVEHLEDGIPLESLSSHFRDLKFEQIFVEILDVCGGIGENDEKKLCWRLAKEILMKISDPLKYTVMIRIIKNYQWDIAKGLMIDWFCQEFVKEKVDVRQCFELINTVVVEDMTPEFIDTLQASLVFHKLICSRIVKSGRFEEFARYHEELVKKYENIFKDYSKAYDANVNVPKLGLVLLDMKELLGRV